MNRNIVIAIVFGAVLMCASAYAGDTAAGEQDAKSATDTPRGHWRGHPMDRMVRHLNLTDEQRTRIEAILRESRTESQAIRAELQELREQLQSTVQQDVFYEDQARTQAELMTPAMVDLIMLGMRTMHAVRSELTPEQQAQAEKWMGRFGGMGGPMRGWGPRHRFSPPEGD